MKTTLSRRAFLQCCLASLAAGLTSGCRHKPSTVTPASTAIPAAPSVTPSINATVTPEPVTLQGTETWRIDSQFIDQSYQIFINLPASYGSSQRFPVLYVTDGNALFPLARAIYGELKNENRIPELLIVGIGYPPEQSTLISDLRGRDLTPYVYARDYSPSPQMSFNLGTGGAPKFVRFIREQLKPTIDARYTTIPGDAAHFGHSLGGLFCLYTLFQEPALFNRFVAASPSIWWANAAIFGAEGDYAASHRDLPARLFIGAGREEGTEGDDITKMADVLRQRAYPGLQVSTQVFEGQAHGTMVPYCLSQGLRAVY